MRPPLRTVHVTFGDVAAVKLREALAAAGRDEAVIPMRDCYGFGPIDPPDPALRAEWMREELEYAFEADDSLARETEDFWAASLAENVHPVVWGTRTTACEYPGRLAWIERAQDRAWALVELTDAPVTTADGTVSAARATGRLTPAQLATFFGTERALTDTETAAARALWSRLRRENAPLRAVTPEGLVSVPLSFFDADLIACTPPDWTTPARIVGDLLHRQHRAGLYQVGDLFLNVRLHRLVAAGLIEAGGPRGTLRARSDGAARLMPR